jgi:hypothetical protein
MSTIGHTYGIALYHAEHGSIFYKDKRDYHADLGAKMVVREGFISRRIHKGLHDMDIATEGHIAELWALCRPRMR